MSFLFPSLALLGAALAAVPVLVHLLTRRRRRRVAWGAMEFLLASSRRRQTWLRWSEWLLLALRVAVVLMVGAFLAKPLVPDAFAQWFGGQATTHLVLLDDSFSMAERTATGSAWDRATAAIGRLAEFASRRSTEGRIVLVHYSDAPDTRPFARDLTDGASDELTRRLATESPGVSAVGPVDALRRLSQLTNEAKAAGEACYTHVFSDFRSWNHECDPAFIAAVEALAAESEGLLLAPCATKPTANLTLTDLAFEPGPLAAGVEMTARLTVQNNGPSIAEGVTVLLRRDGQPLTTLGFDPIGPGEQAFQRCPARFAEVGEHTLTAELPPDSTPADNHRWLALKTPSSNEVRLFDGSTGGREGQVFAAALHPKGSATTGWHPRTKQSKRLQSLGDLSPTATICLLDPEQVSQQATRELERFVTNGGGLLLVLGPHTAPDFLKGPLVPFRFGTPAQAPWVEPQQPSLKITDHRVFQVFAGRRNSFLSLVRVTMRHTTGELPTNSEVKTLASLIDGTPLVLEHRLGKGRVITMLTPAAATGEGNEPWSNLATLPIFPILANELAGWLAQEKLRPNTLLVNDRAPRLTKEATRRLERLAEDHRVETTRSLAKGESFRFDMPGIYRMSTTESVDSPEWFAVNGDPREGNLEAPSVAQLKRLLGDVATVKNVEATFRETDNAPGGDESRLAACLLLGLLVAERALAYQSSYTNATTLGRTA